MKAFKCPVCGDIHNYKVIEFPTFARIDGTELPYTGVTYECDKCSEITADARARINEINAIRIKEARRAIKGLLTAHQIKELRKNKLHLSVGDLALIIGIGEASLKRYEVAGGNWQNGCVDSLFRMFDRDLRSLLFCLECQKAAFSADQYMKLKDHIICLIENNEN